MGDLNLLNAFFDQENFLFSFDKDDFASKRIDKQDVSLICFNSTNSTLLSVNFGHNLLYSLSILQFHLFSLLISVNSHLLGRAQ